MSNAFYQTPIAFNEPIKEYRKDSPERKEIEKIIKEFRNRQIEIPMFINGKSVKSEETVDIFPPHDIHHKLGSYYKGDASHIDLSIKAALKAKKKWAKMPWKDRVAIFLKAAELISGPYRAKLNVATMLGQSKNVFQAEIDAACELIDFLRFNAQYMTDIYSEQPDSDKGIWNSLEYRPLEGFIFAVTPFNFTAIAGNLCIAPALMGNVIVWKPSKNQIYSANILVEVFKKAGLPDGVINMVMFDSNEAKNTIFKHPEFAGIHFTGSTRVFKNIWKEIGENINCYNSYPRIIGETGGKDFIIAHKTANVKEVATGIIRGGFEYQGQKCSAASRIYLPNNISNEIISELKKELSTIKMGGVENFSNFINAVIDENSFDKISNYIMEIKQSKEAEIIIGGNYDKSKGYFIEPTVVITTNPKFKTMCEEIFGPVVTLYVYDENEYEETLNIINETSEYALTGAVFSIDREAIILAMNILENAAGNFYINDKPTGAVVGQQPFGGARGSGTNDKAGSYLNLIRWVSPRTIKETFVTPTSYKYPFLD